MLVIAIETIAKEHLPSLIFQDKVYLELLGALKTCLKTILVLDRILSVAIYHFMNFSKRGGDFSKGRVTIHCLVTKISELGACFIYFSYVLAQNGE